MDNVEQYLLTEINKYQKLIDTLKTAHEQLKTVSNPRKPISARTFKKIGQLIASLETEGDKIQAICAAYHVSYQDGEYMLNEYIKRTSTEETAETTSEEAPEASSEESESVVTAHAIPENVIEDSESEEDSDNHNFLDAESESSEVKPVAPKVSNKIASNTQSFDGPTQQNKKTLKFPNKSKKNSKK